MTHIKHALVAVIAAVAVVALVASPASALVYGTSGTQSTADRSSDVSGQADPNIVFKTHPVRSVSADGEALEVAATRESVGTGDSSGFDWGAASIGAATVLGLGILISAAVLVNRRRHRPAAHTTASA